MPTAEAMAGLVLLDNRRAHAAYTQLEPFIIAQPADALRPVRADVNVICSRAFAMLPRLRAIRADAVAHFKVFDLEQFDSIELRILAAHYANQMWLSATRDKVELVTQAEILTDWRVKLLTAAKMLAAFGLVSAEPLQKVGTDAGYAGLVNDVATLLGVLQRAGETALLKTPLTEADLAVAERDVLEMQTALGLKEIEPVKREQAATLRLQAFNFLLVAFESAYRAAFFLYGRDRADELLPSLFPDYVNRRKSRGTEEGEPDAEVTNPATGISTPGAGGGTVTNVAANVSPAPHTGAVPPGGLTNATGLPLSHPLES